MKNFNELRKEYEELRYRSYNISEDESKIKIEYEFEIPKLAIFRPSIEIEKRNINFKILTITLWKI